MLAGGREEGGSQFTQQALRKLFSCHDSISAEMMARRKRAGRKHGGAGGGGLLLSSGCRSSMATRSESDRADPYFREKMEPKRFAAALAAASPEKFRVTELGR